MEYNVTVEPERSLAIISVYGDYTLQGTMSMLAELAQHPRWKKNFHILVDLREADLNRLPAKDLNEISAFIMSTEGHSGDGRRAYVVPPFGQLKILKHKWNMLMSNSPLERKLFQPYEFDKAIEWMCGEK